VRKLALGLLTLFAVTASAVSLNGLPDPKLTPGMANPSVTPQNMAQNICNPKWSTKSVRPPTGYTNDLKKKQIVQYGYADKTLTHYEEDHLIPLTVGGNPRDPKNLWPQPRTGQWTAVQKDALEVRAHKLVCSGKVPLRTMQREIAKDWIQAYRKYVVVSPLK